MGSGNDGSILTTWHPPAPSRKWAHKWTHYAEPSSKIWRDFTGEERDPSLLFIPLLSLSTPLPGNVRLAWSLSGRSTVYISVYISVYWDLEMPLQSSLLSEPLNILNSNMTPLLSNQNWKTGFRKQMGYYFVIMVFHIYIARSERNCNIKN